MAKWDPRLDCWPITSASRSNFDEKLKPLRRTAHSTTDIYEPLTRTEMLTIFEYLNAHHRPFARLALMIYYSWARTIELCAKLKPLKVVVNAGNGGAGLVIDRTSDGLAASTGRMNVGAALRSTSRAS